MPNRWDVSPEPVVHVFARSLGWLKRKRRKEAQLQFEIMRRWQ